MVHPSLNGYDSAMSELLLDRHAAAPDPDRADSDGLDRIGLALADPIRRKVLVGLLHGSQCPSDLAEVIGTSRSNLSNHLACLRGCGLIKAERAGRHLRYELVSDEFAHALRTLLAVAEQFPGVVKFAEIRRLENRISEMLSRRRARGGSELSGAA